MLSHGRSWDAAPYIAIRPVDFYTVEACFDGVDRRLSVVTDEALDVGLGHYSELVTRHSGLGTRAPHDRNGLGIGDPAGLNMLAVVNRARSKP